MRPLACPRLALALGARSPPCPAAGRSTPVLAASPRRERAALHAEIRAYLLAQPRAPDRDDPDARGSSKQAATAEQRPGAGRRQRRRRSSTTASPSSAATRRAASPSSSSSTTSAASAAGPSPSSPSCSPRDGDIRLIVKEMPILGPGSELAARAAVATLIAEGPEAYAALHDRLMRLEGRDRRRAASTRRWPRSTPPAPPRSTWARTAAGSASSLP